MVDSRLLNGKNWIKMKEGLPIYDQGRLDAQHQDQMKKQENIKRTFAHHYSRLLLDDFNSIRT
jgi:hypothetical protein